MALLCLQKPKAGRPKLKAYLLFTLLLCLFGGQSMAQEIKPINLGQKIPLAILNQKYPAFSTNAQQPDSVSLGQFKGKLILLDFWSTTCSTCIYKFELLGKLQDQYRDQLQVLLVNARGTKDTPERMKGILTGEKAPFVKSDLTTIYKDTVLNKLFPHSYLPHYVWLGAKGELLAITGADMVNEQTVQLFLADIESRSKKAQGELSKKP